MNIDFYNTFLTVMQTRSFTKTAHITNLSQSTVSNRIIELEKHYDNKLFHRKAGRIEPTQGALDLVAYAEDILTTHRLAKHKLNQKHETRDVKIGSVHAFYDSFLESLVQGQLTESHSERLCIALKHSNEIIQGVVSGKYQIGISHHPCNYNNFNSELLSSDALVFVSRMINKDTLSGFHYEQLKKLRIFHSNLFEKYFEDALFVQNAYDYSIDVSSRVLPLILSHDAYAFMPRKVVEPYLNKILYEYPIKDYTIPPLDYYLIYPKNLKETDPQCIRILHEIKNCI